MDTLTSQITKLIWEFELEAMHYQESIDATRQQLREGVEHEELETLQDELNHLGLRLQKANGKALGARAALKLI